MIVGLITSLVVGCLCIVFGAVNMTGNLSTLHLYHYHRVSEQDRKSFGRLVGSGTILVGVSILLYGVFMFAYEKTQSDQLVWIGTSVMLVGIIVGLGISFYGMIKYNKGIF